MITGTGTILDRNFEAIPSIPFESSEFQGLDGTHVMWVAVESDQNGTLYLEVYNPTRGTWATFVEEATTGGASAAGADSSGVTPGIADVTVHDVGGSLRHRVRWLPDGAGSPSFVSIRFGTSGV